MQIFIIHFLCWFYLLLQLNKYQLGAVDLAEKYSDLRLKVWTGKDDELKISDIKEVDIAIDQYQMWYATYMLRRVIFFTHLSEIPSIIQVCKLPVTRCFVNVLVKFLHNMCTQTTALQVSELKDLLNFKSLSKISENTIKIRSRCHIAIDQGNKCQCDTTEELLFWDCCAFVTNYKLLRNGKPLCFRTLPIAINAITQFIGFLMNEHCT